MLTREDVTYWFCRYRMLDTKRLEERRRLIDGFVNSVIVYDEYIVITFNYKEGTTTVPFSKLDSSDLSSVGGPKTWRWLKPSPCLSFDRRFEYSNATVRWTVACCRLDDGNSLLSAKRKGTETPHLDPTILLHIKSRNSFKPFLLSAYILSCARKMIPPPSESIASIIASDSR